MAGTRKVHVPMAESLQRYAELVLEYLGKTYVKESD